MYRPAALFQMSAVTIKQTRKNHIMSFMKFMSHVKTFVYKIALWEAA